MGNSEPPRLSTSSLGPVSVAGCVAEGDSGRNGIAVANPLALGWEGSRITPLWSQGPYTRECETGAQSDAGAVKMEGAVNLGRPMAIQSHK